MLEITDRCTAAVVHEESVATIVVQWSPAGTGHVESGP